MKSFKCSDLMKGCDYEARGNTEEEVLRKAAEHGKEKHGITQMTDDLKNQVKSKIRDVKAA